MSKITLPLAELKSALTGFSKVTSKRMTLPVLNHIHIERTNDGWIGLTVTDLEHYLTLRLEQPSEGEPVSLLLPYDELAKIAKSCGKDDAILLRSEKKASAVSVILEYAIGNQVAEAKVDSLPVDEFPAIPRIKGDSIALSDSIRSSIHEALECASEDETRLILNGAYVDVSKPGAHYVVGTDGRHLYSSNSFSLPLEESLIIPSHKFLGWREFSKDGEWQLKVGEKLKDEAQAFQISSRRWRFISRKIEGNFPNWRQVVPGADQFATSIQFDPQSTDQLTRTIEQMPCHDAINFAVGIEVVGKKVSLAAHAPNAEKWTKVPLEGVEAKGKDVTIYLNRHLFIKALTFGLHTVEIIDPLSPLRFSNGGRQMIIMPTRPEGATPAPAPSTNPATEQNGKGEADPVNSNQPAASSAANNERNPMPKASTNGNGTNGHHEDPKPALDTAVEQIEAIKASVKSAVGGLNNLLDTLKQVQREHKASEREVQSVRSTLGKLQGVKL